MRVAYEHISLIPTNDLAREITESYMEDSLAENSADRLQTIKYIYINEDETVYNDIFGEDSDFDDDEKLQPIGTAAALFNQMTNLCEATT